MRPRVASGAKIDLLREGGDVLHALCVAIFIKINSQSHPRALDRVDGKRVKRVARKAGGGENTESSSYYCYSSYSSNAGSIHSRL